MFMQVHYQFAEHRQRLEDAVDQIVAVDYKPIPSHNLPLPQQNTSKLSTSAASEYKLSCLHIPTTNHTNY